MTPVEARAREHYSVTAAVAFVRFSIPFSRPMRYNQLDRIVELDPGRRLVAQRTLRADEPFLLDHFPKFPVMPGVMMLEALHQAAIWMIRSGDDFAHPLVLLKEARGVKFGDFLCPGETLDVTVQWLKDDGPLVSVKAIGEKNGRTTVSARLVLEKCSTHTPQRLGTDELVAAESRQKFESLFGPLDQIGPLGQIGHTVHSD